MNVHADDLAEVFLIWGQCRRVVAVKREKEWFFGTGPICFFLVLCQFEQINDSVEILDQLLVRVRTTRRPTRTDTFVFVRLASRRPRLATLPGEFPAADLADGSLSKDVVFSGPDRTERGLVEGRWLGSGCTGGCGCLSELLPGLSFGCPGGLVEGGRLGPWLLRQVGFRRIMRDFVDFPRTGIALFI